MAKSKVVSLHALSDDEALTWLQQHSGPVKGADCARAWNWNPMKVSRRIRAWETAGKIARAPEGVKAVASITAPVTARVAAVTLAFSALALAGIGLVLNARYAASFGQSRDAAMLLAALGIVIDVLAIVIPPVAAQLFQQGRYVSALCAWAIWLLALTMVLLTASGFASQNIGDAVAGRVKVADAVVRLTERLHSLRNERANIGELRAVTTIDAALQTAQAGAGAVWRVTSACSDVTRPDSAKLCEPVQRLRQQRGEAVRRDEIDAEVRALEKALAEQPAIAAGDPGAAIVTDLTAWVTAGVIRIGERDVQRIRILGLMVMPSLAGVLLAFGMALRRYPQGYGSVDE